MVPTRPARIDTQEQEASDRDHRGGRRALPAEDNIFVLYGAAAGMPLRRRKRRSLVRRCGAALRPRALHRRRGGPFARRGRARRRRALLGPARVRKISGPRRRSARTARLRSRLVVVAALGGALLAAAGVFSGGGDEPAGESRARHAERDLSPAPADTSRDLILADADSAEGITRRNAGRARRKVVAARRVRPRARRAGSARGASRRAGRHPSGPARPAEAAPPTTQPPAPAPVVQTPAPAPAPAPAEAAPAPAPAPAPQAQTTPPSSGAASEFGFEQ